MNYYCILFFDKDKTEPDETGNPGTRELPKDKPIKKEKKE